MSFLPFNMDAIVDMFTSHSVVVWRYVETYNRGILQKSVTKFRCNASVQPAQGDVLKRPPEADTDGEWLNVYSKFKFHLRDELIIDGLHYQVEKLNNWQPGGKFSHAVCSKMHATEVGPQWVTMVGIPTSSNVGIPTVRATDAVLMLGIASTAAVGTPASIVITNRYIRMNGIASTVVLGTPLKIQNMKILMSGVASTATVGTPTKVEIDWMTNLVARYDFENGGSLGGDSV